ncbi:glutathione S-transferase N-terminal domain-containing protein [Halopiger goleimassiliensis]|uniref:glutathione S-transferase N-terminal domain-containing protein n=1 Tax=Halopiger goleimassiliensis TaxID=1293048 RepID=UPI0006782D55|nr:glutathione S-transferase N-terminal domain-containing protein [Halopiger goleimassiliensis]
MLELYQAEGCPHSQDVREKLTELGLSYVAHNPRTPDDEVKNERTNAVLAELGGQEQTPYLVDDARGEALYESDAIVDYLEKHYA